MSQMNLDGGSTRIWHGFHGPEQVIVLTELLHVGNREVLEVRRPSGQTIWVDAGSVEASRGSENQTQANERPPTTGGTT